MRLSFIILLAAIFQVSASTRIHGQSISLQKTNVSLEEVLKDIQKQSGYHIFYDVLLIDKTPRMTINLNKVTLKEALNQTLKNLNLDYEEVNNNIIIRAQARPKNSLELEKALQKLITGHVFDKNNQPLPGVTVTVKGTRTAAITNGSGVYSIRPEASGSQTLVFTMIGFQTQEVTLSADDSRRDIILVEAIGGLEEVVVVGYGVTSRKNITTSVATIKPENINKAAVSNVSGLLLGRAAGLQATIASPQPDGKVNVSIRGAGEPLYVIDGVIMPASSLEVGAGQTNLPAAINRSGISGLNPQDIESIEILKDASASIYGIGAANGVILITTKKGKTGTPMVSYDGSYSVLQNQKLIEILDANQYMNVSNELSKELYYYDKKVYPYGTNNYDGKWTPKYTQEQIENNAYDTDWVDLVFKKGLINNQNLSFSGGTDKVQYYVGGNYFDQQSTVRNSDMGRYIIRTNLAAQLLPGIKLTTTLNYNQNNYSNSTVGSDPSGGHTYGAYAGAISFPPILPVKRDNIYTEFANIPNPISLEEISDLSKMNALFTNFALDVNIIKGELDAKITYGLNKDNSDRSLYIPSTLYYNQMKRSRGNVGNSIRNAQNMEATVNYRKSWTGVNFDAVVGMGKYLEDFGGSNIYYENINDGIANDRIELAAGPFFPSSYKRENEKRSQFARATVDILDRYVLNASLRRDGTDKFFPGKKYALFPAVSLAWKLTSESFLQDVSWVNLLKLRLSYGLTGRDNLGSSLYGLYSTTNYVRFNNGTTQYTPYLLNGEDYDDVSWEKTSMKNIGLDFSLFKSRIWGSVEVYQNDESSLLRYDSESWLSMFGRRPRNGGQYRREGIELNLNFKNISNKNFEWTSLINLSRNVTTWIEREANYDYKIYQLKENEPYDNFYYYKHTGIINSDRSNMPESQKSLSAAQQMPGFPIISDKNGDQVINEQDIYVDNDGDPKLYLGFGNTFKYKNFDLDIFMYGRMGIRKWNHGLAFGHPSNLISIDRNVGTSIFDVYNSQTNPESSRPGVAYFTRGQALPGGVGVDMDVKDASFIRVRNISLGYTIQKSQLGVVGKVVQNARLFVDVQNPIVFTNYPIIDPEIVTGGGQSSMVSFPQARTFSFGTRISF